MTTILVVDDNMELLSNLCEFLDLEGYHTVQANNGRAGVRAAMEHHPDLIICDVMMPDLDGYGMLRELRAYRETNFIPFIFLTAQSAHENIRSGMMEGADDYLIKPFDYDMVLAAIEVRLRKQAEALARIKEQRDVYQKFIVTTLPHELRTPLMGILGAGELLSTQPEELGFDKVKELATWIVRSGKRLHHSIENYLLYSQLSATQPSQAFMAQINAAKTTYPSTLILELLKERSENSTRCSDITFNFGNDVDLNISADFLAKIVNEILDNAFKFSDAGTPIHVETWVLAHEYMISIEDKGRGMTKLQKDSIGAFVQFEREHYEQQGSGLGLAIVKRLLDLHNGKLTIESQPQKGTKILLEIPRSI